MSNTSNDPAKTGSKYWMQNIINTDAKTELHRKIGIGEVHWISPVKSDNYREYTS